jgi:glycine cleavage system H protein
MSDHPDHLHYAETHEWVRDEEGGLVVVGITEFAQKQLGDVVFLELPKIGQMVKAKAPVAVIESVKAASDIHAPLSGEVVEINLALTSEPEKVNADPYEAWMFKIRPTQAEEKSRLMSATAYEARNAG